jgi:hypothetical protein
MAAFVRMVMKVLTGRHYRGRRRLRHGRLRPSIIGAVWPQADCLCGRPRLVDAFTASSQAPVMPCPGLSAPIHSPLGPPGWMQRRADGCWHAMSTQQSILLRESQWKAVPGPHGRQLAFTRRRSHTYGDDDRTRVSIVKAGVFTDCSVQR